MVRIYIASDHAGFKQGKLKKFLQTAKSIKLEDLERILKNQLVPDYAKKSCVKVAKKKFF